MKQMISEFFIYYSIYYLYIWIVLDSFLEIDLHRVDRPLRILFRKFFDSFDISMFLLSTSLLCYAHTIQIIDINSLIYDYRLPIDWYFYFLLSTSYFLPRVSLFSWFEVLHFWFWWFGIPEIKKL